MCLVSQEYLGTWAMVECWIRMLDRYVSFLSVLFGSHVIVELYFTIYVYECMHVSFPIILICLHRFIYH